MFFQIITLWAILTIGLYAATPLCKITESWTRLNERLHQEGLLLGESLKGKLDGNTAVTTNPRFVNDGGLRHEIIAQQQIGEGMGAAEAVCPNYIDDTSSQAWVDSMTQDRVLWADEIPFETIGEGYGHLAAGITALPNLSDVEKRLKIAELLTKNKAVFDNPTGPYLAAGYGEAHMMRDAKIIFEGNGNLPANNFCLNMAAGSRGYPFECRAAASRRQNGETLVALDADATHGKGVDVVSNQAVYSCKTSTAGVTNAIVDGNGQFSDDGRAIAQAVLQNETGSKPYIFLVPSGDVNEVSTAFDLLNIELTRIGATSRVSVASNIKIVPLQ